MDAKTYQECALRTMANQNVIRQRLYDMGSPITQLENGIRGLTNEVGELSEITKKSIEYGKGPPDREHIKEEVGDCFWRLRQICDAVGLTFEECMQANIDKLAIRYPKEFSDVLAQEENRDRAAEREAMTQQVVSLEKNPNKPTCSHGNAAYHDGSSIGTCLDCGDKVKDHGYAQNDLSKAVFPKPNCEVCEGSGQVGGKDASFNSPSCPKCYPPEAKLPENWDKDSYTQNGQGWAEPAEDFDALPPVVKCEVENGTVRLVKSFEEPPQSVVRPKPLNHSYTRYCKLCGIQPVHKTNELQICTPCFILHGEVKELTYDAATTG